MSIGDVDDTNNGGNRPPPCSDDAALVKQAEANCLQSQANKGSAEALQINAEALKINAEALLALAEANRLQSHTNKETTDRLRQQHERESITLVTPHENRGNTQTQHHPPPSQSRETTSNSGGGGDLLPSPPKVPRKNLPPDMGFGSNPKHTDTAAAKPAPAAKPSAINASAGTKEVWANIFQKRGRGDYADGNAKKKRKLSDSSSVAVVPPSSAGESTAKGDGDDEEKSTAMTKMEGKRLVKTNRGNFLPASRICAVDKCKSQRKAGMKYCIKCAKKNIPGYTPPERPTCVVAGCTNKQQRKGMCDGCISRGMLQKFLRKRTEQFNDTLQSSRSHRPAFFDRDAHNHELFQQKFTSPPGFEELNARVADFLESPTEPNRLAANEAYNIAASSGFTFSHPPTSAIPPPRTDSHNPFCGSEKKPIPAGYDGTRGKGPPTGKICESTEPTVDEVIDGLIGYGCNFDEDDMFAHPHPDFTTKVKSNQRVIVSSDGVVYLGTVDEDTNELSIKAFGVPAKDAHDMGPWPNGKYQCGPGNTFVHLWVAAAFGLDLQSGGGIDHRNRIPGDNRVVNLYSATRFEQNRNQGSSISYYNR